jgi:hypothetical protein
MIPCFILDVAGHIAAASIVVVAIVRTITVLVIVVAMLHSQTQNKISAKKMHVTRLHTKASLNAFDVGST